MSSNIIIVQWCLAQTVDCPLQYLDLGYNDITEVGIQILAEALQVIYSYWV